MVGCASHWHPAWYREGELTTAAPVRLHIQLLLIGTERHMHYAFCDLSWACLEPKLVFALHRMSGTLLHSAFSHPQSDQNSSTRLQPVDATACMRRSAQRSLLALNIHSLRKTFLAAMHPMTLSLCALLPATLAQHIADHILNGLSGSYFDREEVSPIAGTITITSTSTATVDVTSTVVSPLSNMLVTACSAPSATAASVNLNHQAIDQLLGDLDDDGVDVHLTCINCTTTGLITASAAGFSDFSTNFS